MEVVLYSGMFVVSLAALLKGADWLIGAAEEIGLAAGIPQFVIGVTIVAFGTSLPELATAIAAVQGGESGLVVSTVAGSNIANIALVLGLVAIMGNGITLEKNIWHSDIPYLWGSAFLMYFALYDRTLDAAEAVIFLLGIVIFLAYSFKPEETDVEVIRHRPGWRSWLFMLLGIVSVWIGADYTVVSITKLSEIAGIPSEIIGLSVVSIGTSLPEIIVSVNAARKGKSSIAVGNVLGSNIFNIFVVMGIPALLGPLQVSEDMISFYIPFMLALTILFGVKANNQNISRWEGAMFLLFYVYFMYYLLTN